MSDLHSSSRLKRRNASRIKGSKVRQRQISLFVLCVMIVPAMVPLTGQDFTCGYDNVFHLWRAVQVDALWSQGVFYSRWAPDMAGGYGFPLFVFTSPGPSMIAALLHRGGLAFPKAINFTFAIGIMLGALFMFMLADDLFGPSAGLVAAAAYVYAPFQAYDVYNRGSLWESFAWAFPPLVLWGIEHWLKRKERRGLVWGVIGLAAMVLSHHLFSFLFAPLFAVWVFVSAYRERDWRVLWRGVLLGLLGMGLTTFFWLPPLLERQFVQTERLIGTWVFDYRFNFISLKHLFSVPRFSDHLLINDWPEKALGLVPVILSSLAFVGFRKTVKKRRWAIAVLAIMAVIFSLFTLPVSRLVWDVIPLLSYVQFPWRFLGPAAFCIALLAGAACAALSKHLKIRSSLPWHTFVLLSLLILANLGWFFPDHCEAPGEISLRAMLQWEELTDTLGTTAKGEYLPIWVQKMPVHPSLRDAYRTDAAINRVDLATLPGESSIMKAEFGAVSDVVQINAADEFRIQWLRFYYPGWHVKIDGEVVDVFPATGTGLLTFDVPAGNHMIAVDFIETPLRLVADGVSIVAVIAFVLILVFNRFLTITKKASIQVQRRPYILFSIVFLLFVILYGGKEWSVWRGSRLQSDGTLRGLDIAFQVNFDNKASLIGVDNMPSSIAGDATPEITLYWRAINPGNNDWQVGLSLVGSEGEVQHNVDLRPARWARTPPPLAEWPKDQYARMDYILNIPPGIAPGQYDLSLKLFDRDTLLPASVLGADGNPQGPDIVLGSVTINAPKKPYPLDSLGVPGDAQPVICGPLKLWSMETDRETAAPGDVVALQWVWEAAVQPNQDIRIPITLVDAEGDEIWVWDVPLIASWWSTERWKAGERWSGNLGLRIPGSTETDSYMVIAGKTTCETPVSVPIDIIAPERNWTVPDIYSPLEVVFGANMALKGYVLNHESLQPGEVLELSLAWEGLIQMDVSYRVFVHVTAEDGTILVQNDGEPAGWMRPTTGWAVNEIVIDDRPLLIPVEALPGSYSITAGVYHEDGARLTLPDGSDVVQLGVIDVE